MILSWIEWMKKVIVERNQSSLSPLSHLPQPQYTQSITMIGRLIDQQRLWEMRQPDLPEDFNIFLSKYDRPWMSSPVDWPKTSKVSFPDLNFIVHLQRFDLYSCTNPPCQLGTTNSKDSAKYRRLAQFSPLRSFFLFNDHYDYTKTLEIDMAAPPQVRTFCRQ